MQTIDVRGYIVPDEDVFFYRYFGYAATAPKDIYAALKKAGKESVTVRINSYGGDVWSGSEIYTTLREHEPGVTTVVTGLAASAASIILMAGNTVRASPTAEIMIHNPSSGASGDHRAMEQAARSLRNTREAIVNSYELKTGLARAKLREMLNAETWMTAQSAQELGFVDEILFDEDGKLNSIEPEESENDSGSAGAKAAAFSMPSCTELRAKHAVWNEIAPGARTIDEAREMLAASRAAEISENEPRQEKEAEMEPAEETENDAERQSKDALEIMRARVMALAT